MKKCRFHDPHYLSQYYDGSLDVETEKAFAEHLLKCNECMKALLDLDRDLFIMNNVKHNKLPHKYASGKITFLLLPKGIELIKGFGHENGFQQFVPLPARGGGKGSAYRLERGDVSVDIMSEGKDRFNIEFNGVFGKKIRLFRNNRLIEARSNIRDRGVIVYNLEKGNYSLVINDQDSIKFTVE
jgi:hypothetical protein